MHEEWRNIEGFPGYQVSNTGKVRSYINNRHGIGDIPHELKQCTSRNNYKSVQLGRKNRKLVSRLVASAFIPNPDELPLVRHMDDDPTNNNVDNLAWGTQGDNMQDCVRHGRLVGDTSAAIIATKKSVVATPLEGGETIEFSSIHDAARELDLWPQHISRVARGELRQTGGYYFHFVDDSEEEEYGADY